MGHWAIQHSTPQKWYLWDKQRSEKSRPPGPRVFRNWPQKTMWRFEGPTMFKNFQRFDNLINLATSFELATFGWQKFLSGSLSGSSCRPAHHVVFSEGEEAIPGPVHCRTAGAGRSGSRPPHLRSNWAPNKLTPNMLKFEGLYWVGSYQWLGH